MDILADTNVLLRRIHRRDPQHRTAQRCLNRLIAEGHRICVTSQNLIELWAVCTRPIDNNGLGLDPVQTERILARVERAVVRIPDPDNVYSEWRRLVVTHGVSGKKSHDARLVALMEYSGDYAYRHVQYGRFRPVSRNYRPTPGEHRTPILKEWRRHLSIGNDGAYVH